MHIVIGTKQIIKVLLTCFLFLSTASSVNAALIFTLTEKGNGSPNMLLSGSGSFTADGFGAISWDDNSWPQLNINYVSSVYDQSELAAQGELKITVTGQRFGRETISSVFVDSVYLDDDNGMFDDFRAFDLSSILFIMPGDLVTLSGVVSVLGNIADPVSNGALFAADTGNVDAFGSTQSLRLIVKAAEPVSEPAVLSLLTLGLLGLFARFRRASN